ncbi:hypothetical protein GcM1_172009 [Golovinomyces cichoracearum]|uniref:Uncharacterized protein n=1 Tax=Golovinomyces cichoracearum TaxID=62708 RepID=A0A420J6F2_9PEZI|nr:hypothetical protein GcM1_172009 [Golovinomyces cichoracearum]
MPLPFNWEYQTADSKSLAAKEKLSRKDAQYMAVTLKNYTDTARESLKRTQDRMVKQANKHRREPDIGIGDKFFIIKRAWSSTDRPSDKLDFPLTRLSNKIKAMRGYSYEHESPENWKMKDSNNPLPDQEYGAPNPEIIDDEEEREVENILSSRPEYYNADNFINAPLKIREFHEQNPNCEGPPVRLKIWEKVFTNDKFAKPHGDDNKPEKLFKGLIVPRRMK